MSNETEYNTYVLRCKQHRKNPIAYDIWIRNKNQGNKLEIGFDVINNHTGNPSTGCNWSTSEGECLK